MHPMAANLKLEHRYAPPFVFLVTGLPKDFHKWLVATGVHEVDSHLRLLFIENRDPVPHNYAVTLTNYNMRMETEVLREHVHHRVQRSVTNLLFDKPTDTSKCILHVITRYHDNLDETLSGEEARTFVRNSVCVSSMDVIVPETKIMTTIYNVYIHLPTATPDLLKQWREFIQAQKFYTDVNGVRIQYQHMWSCLHCKSFDHPSGLCKYMKEVKGKAGKQAEALTVDKMLPLGPTPGPSNCSNPNHGHQGNRSASTQTRARGWGNSTRGNAVHTTGLKR